MTGMMVVIEGLDFVGKTTIARCLAEQAGWLYYKTPPTAYYDACTVLGENGVPVYTDERFYLFIECLKYASQEIVGLIKRGISVAVDRWLWTTLSYHFAFNPGLETRWQKDGETKPLAVACPHLCMLIHIADREVYARRIESRKRLTAFDKMVIGNVSKSSAIADNFKRLNSDFVFIDNSGSLEKTMEVVSAHIGATTA